MGMLAGCGVVGIGTNVDQVAPGQYRIVTSGAEDAALADNQRAAAKTCPQGYTVLGKGDALDKPLNIVFRDSDYAKYLLVQCTQSGTLRS